MIYDMIIEINKYVYQLSNTNNTSDNYFSTKLRWVVVVKNIMFNCTACMSYLKMYNIEKTLIT